MLGNHAQFRNGYIIGGNRTILNQLSVSSAAAYSLRKLRNEYAGNAIRVRRSNDNAESNIGFLANGDLDTTALLTFVGANSAFVTTWYDQSGNNRNATQVNASNQPRIVNNGVVDGFAGRPSVFSVLGTPNHLLTPAFAIAPSRKFLCGAVVNSPMTALGFRRLCVSRASFTNFYIGTGTVVNSIMAVAGSGSFTTQATANAGANIISNAFGTAGNAADVNGIRINGGTQITTPSQTGQLSSLELSLLANGTSSSETWDGHCAEFILLSGDATATDRQTLERNQGQYYGILVP